MKTGYELLLEKLRRFILKYYKNQIIKGLMIGFGLIIGFFLLINAIEYFAWSNQNTRFILYYSFLGISGFVLVYYILIPILRIFNLGKTLSEADAARLIGQHFPEVSDKLLNTLQLHQLQETQQMDLLMASINQKSAELAPIPFAKAINFKGNTRYLKFVLPPVLILLLLAFLSPGSLTQPTDRIINYDVHYEKPLPYTLHVLNKNLTAIQKSDFVLEVEVKGEIIPTSITINDGLYNYRMGEMQPGKFQYIFKTLNQDVRFTLNTIEYSSPEYHIKVFPRPLVYGFEASLTYPNYLAKQNETIENTGDLVVPEGTEVSWKVFTKDADSVKLVLNDSLIWLQKNNSNTFVFQQRALQSFNYSIAPVNEFVRNADSLMFSVQVIKDEYPQISVREFKEDGIYGQTHFSGEINDDHGFYQLNFLYRKDSVPQKAWTKISLQVEKSILKQPFNFSFDAREKLFNPGESISYCFEVRDNDAINGYKRSRSTIFSMQLPDADELADQADNQADEVKKKMKETLTELEKLNKEIEENTLSLFEKKDLSWMDKKKMTDLLEKQASLQNKMEEIQELNKEIEELESLIKQKTDPELQERIDKLQEMFDELMKTDLEKEMEKLQEQMKNLDKDKLEDFLKQMKEKNEDLKENLEQNLELYKQYEVEKKMEEALDKLEELAEKQLDLAEKTREKEMPNDSSIQQQEDIKKEFEELQKEFSQIDSLDQQLEEPFNVEQDTATAEEIEQNMDEAGENLEKSKEKKAAENQKNAGDKMKEMADAMKMQFEEAKAEQMAEDAEQVRTLLDNLIDMSFEQERLLNKIGETSQNDPQYVENTEKLKLLQTDFIVVEDSLKALSKRQIFIQPFILDESGKITKNLDKALHSLQERQTGQAMGAQQYAMTSTNNLSLMLAESLKQMKSSMQMQGQSSGKGQCNSPGSGKKPSLEDLMDAQKKLGERMKKNGKKEGKDGQGGVNGNSQELARMAAMQGEIRRQLQDILDEVQAGGENGNDLKKIAEEMQKNEEDLIRRQFRQETLERQKEIETRLLRSKEALQEREKEKKRESSEGKNRQNRNQNQELKYKDINEGQDEILLTVPIDVSPYYLELYKKYLFKLENDKK